MSDFEALGQAIAPYRWANYLEDAVVEYCSTIDYTVGQVERDDIAQDIINQRIEENAFDSAQVALDALNHWRVTYGGWDA